MRAGSLPSLVAAFALGLAPAGAAAGGFYVPEVGGRAVGMAGRDDRRRLSPRRPSSTTRPGCWAPGGTELELGGDLVLPDVVPLPPPRARSRHRARPSGSSGWPTGNRAARHSLSWRARFALGRADLGARASAPTSPSAPPWTSRATAPSASWSPRCRCGRSTWGRRWPTGSPPGCPSVSAVSYVYADLALSQRNALPFVTGDPEANPNPDPGVEGDTRIEASDPFSLGATLGCSTGGRDDPFTLGLA